jgi:hypothetical protein
MLDCARAIPLWTGTMDPFVLDVSVDAGGNVIDLHGVDYREVVVEGRRHILLGLPAGTLQLELFGANDGGRIVRIKPLLNLARPLEPQFHSVRRLSALMNDAPEPVAREAVLARLVEALRVCDALADGASQRDIGLGIFGDDWPGDGEHLKSRVRRMIPFASKFLQAGPQGVFKARI